MSKKPSITEIGSLSAEYRETLALSGLVDDVANPALLEPYPYRYAEGEYICRHGDPAERLWIIVNGSVAVRQQDQTLFVRRRNEVIGEQHLVGNGYQRLYDLVAGENSVEVLVVDKAKIEAHPEVGVIWRNIAKIVSIKLRNASRKTASLGRQVADDTRILHAYTNEYALSRRMQSGGDQQTEYMVDRAVIWFSDVVGFSEYTLKTPPERIADIVQRFFNAQSAPILDCGGHIDKFIGDGLMAFWVLSSNGENTRKACFDALQAAEQAAKDVSAITVGNTPLALRIGLHVGQVLSGDFGSTTRHQFTLIGTEVNKAARLEQIHTEDVIEGQGPLGRIRLSREFWEEMSDIPKGRFQNRFVARAKNIGDTEIFTN
jgi:class 3 adenylate cyclase